MSTDTTDRPPTGGSIYPAPVAALLPRARDLVTELGGVPSRNKLMTAFKIGAPKATALRDVLTSGSAALPDAARQRLRLVTGTTGPVPVTVPDPADQPDPSPVPAPVSTVDAPEAAPLREGDGHPGTPVHVMVHDEMTDYVRPAVPDAGMPAGAVKRRRAPRSWPVLLLALPAFIAIWSGWVGLGGLTGFGIVHPLPGIADRFALNSAITLPVGVETYAAYALRAWLTPGVPARARRFAGWSALASLLIGAAGQVTYHLMTAAHVTSAPWPITTAVACLPVAVLGMGAALAHLLHHPTDTDH